VSKKVNFTANQLKFIDWLAQGKYHREPSTQARFAELIGVRPETLTRWKRGQNGFSEQEFNHAVTERARAILDEVIPDTLSALKEEAVKGNLGHIKTILELTGLYTEKVEHQHYVEDARERLADRIAIIAERTRSDDSGDSERLH